mgnify:CR=1 FL=1|jgi:hypothetical protein
MFKNFFQYLFIILMVHFILKKFLLDTQRKLENFSDLHEYQNDENTPRDFNEDYKLNNNDEAYDNIETYETDEESDFDNLKANIINTESDAEESEEEDLLETENKLRSKRERDEILGSNGMDNYREFNFGNDSLDLKSHVKNINTGDFETTFDLNVPTNNQNTEKFHNKDEGIMNGGAFMDNIYGYDSLESEYASL